MGPRIAVGQMHSKAYDVAGNLEKAARLVRAAKGQGAQIVLLPETFPTGYNFGPEKLEHAETIPGPITDFLGELAAEQGVYLYGSMIETDAEEYYNAAPLISPEGDIIAKYRKAHLFGEEKEVFLPGEEAVVVETPLGRLGLTICYDFCFPEYVRGLKLSGADIILNSTNWLTVGPLQDWDFWEWNPEKPTALAVVRALENTISLAMSCQADGLTGSIRSFGHSVIVSPSGRILAQLGAGEGVTTADLPLERVSEWQAIATYMEDRRVDLYRPLLDLG
jgi:predicted amidohydrolase